MEALPFLFAKNDKGAGWSPVVTPSVAQDSEAIKLLLTAQRGWTNNPGEAFYVKGNHSKLGIFDVVFHGRPSGLKDESGRDFDFKEGFVLRSRDPDLKLSQEHLDAVHEAVMPKFREFWDRKSWSDSDAASDAVLKLDEIETKTPLKISHSEATATTREVKAKGALTSEGSLGSWSERAKGAWAKPGVRGVVVASAVVGVVAGAFLIAAHLRRSQRDETRTSPAR